MTTHETFRVPEPPRWADRNHQILEITIASPPQQAVAVIAGALLAGGRFVMKRRQPGRSTWLRTKSPPASFLVEQFAVGVPEWLEKRTGRRIGHWSVVSETIELSAVPDPSGTRVRIVPKAGGQPGLRVMLRSDLQPLLADLDARGLLVAVSRWLRADWKAEQARRKAERRAEPRG